MVITSFARETCSADGDRVDLAEGVVICSVFPQGLLRTLGLLYLFDASGELFAKLGGSFFPFR